MIGKVWIKSEARVCDIYGTRTAAVKSRIRDIEEGPLSFVREMTPENALAEAASAEKIWKDHLAELHLIEAGRKLPDGANLHNWRSHEGKECRPTTGRELWRSPRRMSTFAGSGGQSRLSSGWSNGTRKRRRKRLLMTEREKELFAIALELAVELDRCNPEVGMGPWKEQLAEQINGKLSRPLGKEDLEEATAAAR